MISLYLDNSSVLEAAPTTEGTGSKKDGSDASMTVPQLSEADIDTVLTCMEEITKVFTLAPTLIVSSTFYLSCILLLCPHCEKVGRCVFGVPAGGVELGMQVGGTRLHKCSR